MEPFNPLDPDLARNPYPAYAELSERDRVHLSAIGAHVLTHYEDVKRMLNDVKTFQHQYVAQQRQRGGGQVEDEPYFDYFRRMTFGGGAHRCIGRNLARQEFEVAFTTLLSEHPSVRVVEEGCVFRDTPLMRGLKELPIEW